MTNQLFESGERVSFYNLFKDKGFSVEIPIIQRDYAQGRDSQGEVRSLFLKALYNYLDENIPGRDLDFVYGSVNSDSGNRFVPLDGQQRLTTLFLLHWYLAVVTSNIDRLREVLVNVEGKSRFGYQTRTSSREFCDALMVNDFDMMKLQDADKGKQNALSKTIRNCNWYFLSWDGDPTIKSMLTMLDAIHGMFNGRADFYERLTREDCPVITFLLLNLNEFKLTDDLYIKMNSRGKELTPFETFKAKLEQCMEGYEDRKFLHPSLGEVSAAKYFSFQMDTVWADLFWNYRDTQSDDEKRMTFDVQLANFIRVIFINHYMLNFESSREDNRDYLLNTNDSISFYKYVEVGVLSSGAVYALMDSLDSLSNGGDAIKEYLPDEDRFYFDERKVFRHVIDYKIPNYQERVQFYAYIGFLNRYRENLSGLKDWMRVIHNLTENTQIDDLNQLSRVIQVVGSLLTKADDILGYLAGEDVSVEAFSRRQVEEEQIKARLILSRGKEWRDEIEKAEKHPYFKGQIGFLLYFSGILGACKASGDCDEITAMHYHDFVEYAQRAGLVFDNINSAGNNEYLWERAVLSKGDYLFWTSSWRRNFLHSTANMRDYSWKRALQLPASEEDQEVWRRLSYIKEVLDDERFDINDFSSLQRVHQKTDSLWRNLIIEEPGVLEYCSKQGFAQFPEDGRILLYRASQRNHYHCELLSYAFYLKYLENKPIAPFAEVTYRDYKGDEEDSNVELGGWTYYKSYQVNIYYFVDNDHYCICFKKSKGRNKEEKYAREIVEILEALGFIWKEDWGYCVYKKSEITVYELLTDLCSRLCVL